MYKQYLHLYVSKKKKYHDNSVLHCGSTTEIKYSSTPEIKYSLTPILYLWYIGMQCISFGSPSGKYK